MTRPRQWFACALFVSHAVTAWFWSGFNLGGPRVCWSFIPACDEWLTLSGEFRPFYITVYFAVSLLGAGLVHRATWNQTRVTLLLLGAMKLAFHLSDFRLMGNYHYMAHIIGFAFVLFPEPEKMIRLWLILFYVAAGSLKLSSDWLTGASLVQPLPWSGFWLSASLIYVVALEILIVPLLLRPHRDALFWLIIGQLALFHLVSYWVVGYFYPVIMLLFLSSFFLFRDPISLPVSWLNRAAVVLFVAAQVLPKALDPNSAVTGHWRLLSLNMLDGRTECLTSFLIRNGVDTIEYSPRFDGLGLRIRCDPAVIANHLKVTCTDMTEQWPDAELDVHHQARSSSDHQVATQWSFRDVCRRPVRQTWWGGLVQ